MKKITLVIFVIVASFSFKLKAQITLEHTYPGASTNLYIVNLEVEGQKYIWRNWNGPSLVLYNLDHSIFKNNTIWSGFGRVYVYPLCIRASFQP